MEVKDLQPAWLVSGCQLQAQARGSAGDCRACSGSGRTELLRGIFGADPVDSGEVIIEGKTYKSANPIKMVKAGVGLHPRTEKSRG